MQIVENKIEAIRLTLLRMKLYAVNSINFKRSDYTLAINLCMSDMYFIAMNCLMIFSTKRMNKIKVGCFLCEAQCQARLLREKYFVVTYVRLLCSLRALLLDLIDSQLNQTKASSQAIFST